MVSCTLVNIGLDITLLPDGNKPLPEPMMTDHQRYSLVSTLEQFHNCSRYTGNTAFTYTDFSYDSLRISKS